MTRCSAQLFGLLHMTTLCLYCPSRCTRYGQSSEHTGSWYLGGKPNTNQFVFFLGQSP